MKPYPRLTLQFRQPPWLALHLALAMMLGCGGAPPGGEAPEPRSEAVLEVENLGFADVTIYAISASGSRTRLGQVSGNSTGRLALPSYLVRGGERLRFLADPIGGSQTPVSEELYVAPGEAVTLTIPPR
jgi:hypothetical protein